jgi:hypothetical protein
MSFVNHWKLSGAAVLLGGIVIGLVPREQVVPVQEVIAAARPRAAVLEGEVELLRPNRFLLRDESGEIRLETCPVWYRALVLRPGERVRVQGELAPRKRWLLDRPSFVVHRLRREEGPEIVLRHADGSPRWRPEIMMSHGR